jgi:hypothetical protein
MPPKNKKSKPAAYDMHGRKVASVRKPLPDRDTSQRTPAPLKIEKSKRGENNTKEPEQRTDPTDYKLILRARRAERDAAERATAEEARSATLIAAKVGGRAAARSCPSISCCHTLHSRDSNATRTAGARAPSQE